MSKKQSHEGSEEERFMKALSKCRNCDHMKMAHSFLIVKDGKCIDAKVSEKGTYKECLCRLFAPKDNLEYLEWKFENKQKGRGNQK